MILGVGTDIVDVPDLERRIERGSFRKAFSENELAYADSLPGQRIEILAARWAAKEAFAKALGTGLRVEWPLHELEILHDDAGRPVMALGPSLQDLLPCGAKIHCSLSHTRSQAVATVIIEL